MRLLQLNIWGGRVENRLIGLLAQEKPDILCLQEAVSFDGKGMLNVGLEEICEGLGLQNIFMSPVASIGYMNKTASLGNAIASNVELHDKNTIFTRLQHKENFDFDTDDYNIRNLQHTSIILNGKTVHILNHHGHHVRQHKDGDAETLRQCKQIVDYIKTLTGEVILTGDFNLSPHSESIELINEILCNLSIKYDLKTTRTALTHKTEVCDYIFISDGIKINEFHASHELMSDHMALVLDFSV